jgi:hypothetical protein
LHGRLTPGGAGKDVEGITSRSAGWAAEPDESGPRPTTIRLIEESPGCRSRGFSTFRACFRSGGRLAAHPALALGAHALEVVAEEAAEPMVDGGEQAARDEEPRLGDRVALGVYVTA